MEHFGPELVVQAPTAREQLHRLGTLFVVIASGGHMLGNKVDAGPRAAILRAVALILPVMLPERMMPGAAGKDVCDAG